MMRDILDVRTTITLDADVVARLDRLRRERPFKDLVNAALRCGLDALESGAEETTVYRVETVAGRPRRVDLDNVAEVLAEVDGDWHS